MAKNTGPTKATVHLVWNRDGGSCLRCGAWLRFEDRGERWSIHHRVARGMGGSPLPWVNLAANLIVLCGSGVTGCHGWVESNRDKAYEQGWLIRRHGSLLPEQVDIENGRHLIRLHNDGRKEYALAA